LVRINPTASVFSLANGDDDRISPATGDRREQFRMRPYLVVDGFGVFIY
jgi:hypothetical protein